MNRRLPQRRVCISCGREYGVMNKRQMTCGAQDCEYIRNAALKRMKKQDNAGNLKTGTDQYVKALAKHCFDVWFERGKPIGVMPVAANPRHKLTGYDPRSDRRTALSKAIAKARETCFGHHIYDGWEFPYRIPDGVTPSQICPLG